MAFYRGLLSESIYEPTPQPDCLVEDRGCALSGRSIRMSYRRANFNTPASYPLTPGAWTELPDNKSVYLNLAMETVAHDNRGCREDAPGPYLGKYVELVTLQF